MQLWRTKCCKMLPECITLLLRDVAGVVDHWGKETGRPNIFGWVRDQRLHGIRWALFMPAPIGYTCRVEPPRGVQLAISIIKPSTTQPVPDAIDTVQWKKKWIGHEINKSRYGSTGESPPNCSTCDLLSDLYRPSNRYSAAGCCSNDSLHLWEMCCLLSCIFHQKQNSTGSASC